MKRNFIYLIEYTHTLLNMKETSRKTRLAQELQTKTIEELLEQYNPLIEKITNQQWSGLTDRQREILEYQDVKSYALEGFIMAVRSYDVNKSSMDFCQYAAFGIKNACMNNINEDSRTIKISYYYQQKLKEQGYSTIMTTSLNKIIPNTDSDVDSDRYAFLGREDNDLNGGHPLIQLVNAIKENFDKDTATIFIDYYGLGDKDDVKGIDLAKKYAVSNATITSRLKKVIDWIRKDKELMESLSQLL